MTTFLAIVQHTCGLFLLCLSSLSYVVVLACPISRRNPFPFPAPQPQTRKTPCFHRTESLTCMYPVAACTSPDAPPNATMRCCGTAQDKRQRTAEDIASTFREILFPLLWGYQLKPRRHAGRSGRYIALITLLFLDVLRERGNKKN